MKNYYHRFKLICHCLAPCYDEKDLADIRRRLSQRDIPFQRLIDIANDYFVTPGVWSGLKNKGLETLLDDESSQYLHTLHALNQERNTHLSHQLIEAVGVLNQAGIKPLLFKGSGQLLQPVHHDIGSRIMSDLDMLIPLEQIPAATDALMKKGYGEADVTYDAQKLHHCAPLVRSGDYGPIELHRRVFQNEISHVLPTQKIWEDAQSHSVNGVHFYLPSPTHSILICLLHSQEFNSSYDPRLFNPRALQDLAAIVRRDSKDIDWPLIRRIMKAHGLTSLAGFLLLSANRLMGMPLPKDMTPGPASRLLYMMSLGAMDWPVVDRLSLYTISFSTHLICLRYGCSLRWLPVTAYRFRYLLFLISRRLGY